MEEQILISLAGILVVGIVTQWLAWRLRLPSILLLLAAGMCIGPGTALLARGQWISGRFLDPDELFGKLLLPFVSMSVALILFDGGLSLNLRELTKAGRVIWSLVSLGAAITWALTILAARLIVGISWPLSVLLGAILVVTGPTVIGPLLRHVRPRGQTGPILKWEGIIIDPIGAMLAVVVFEAILTGRVHVGSASFSVLRTVLIGTTIGLAGAMLMVVALRRMWVPDLLHNALNLMLVIVAFTLGNYLQSESGLFAVTVMGLVLANQRYVQVHHIAEFKESLTLLLISALFVILGARLNLEQLGSYNWRTLAFVLVLIVLVRPVAVFACTIGTTLTWKERAFLAALAPRGIVAAAVSSVFALRLRDLNFPQADALVPLTFAVIIGTVSIYGLSAAWTARRLGISRPGALGFLFVGANPVARGLALAIQKESYEVLLVDTNSFNIQSARLAGLPVAYGSILSNVVQEELELSSIGRLLAMTPNEEVNSLAVVHFGRQFGRDSVYQLATAPASGRKEKVSKELHGHLLFGPAITYDLLLDRIERGAVFKRTNLTAQFTYAQFRALHGEDAIPMLLITDTGEASLFSVDSTPTPKPGQAIVSLISPNATGAPAVTPQVASAAT